MSVVGDPTTYRPEKDDIFLCAVGDPLERRRYASPIVRKGGEFIVLVHPLASVSAFVSLGRGSMIGPFASVSPDVRIGEFVTVNSYTGIGHDVKIGSWCEIDGHCLIAGRACIGDRFESMAVRQSHRTWKSKTTPLSVLAASLSDACLLASPYSVTRLGNSIGARRHDAGLPSPISGRPYRCVTVTAATAADGRRS